MFKNALICWFFKTIPHNVTSGLMMEFSLTPPTPARPPYLELLALPPQDADLVGLQGRHVLLHLEGQLLGVCPLLRQFLCR